jgi:hypothetical protein
MLREIQNFIRENNTDIILPFLIPNIINKNTIHTLYKCQVSSISLPLRSKISDILVQMLTEHLQNLANKDIHLVF